MKRKGYLITNKWNKILLSLCISFLLTGCMREDTPARDPVESVTPKEYEETLDEVWKYAEFCGMTRLQNDTVQTKYFTVRLPEDWVHTVAYYMPDANSICFYRIEEMKLDSIEEIVQPESVLLYGVIGNISLMTPDETGNQVMISDVIDNFEKMPLHGSYIISSDGEKSAYIHYQYDSNGLLVKEFYYDIEADLMVFTSCTEYLYDSQQDISVERHYDKELSVIDYVLYKSMSNGTRLSKMKYTADGELLETEDIYYQ